MNWKPILVATGVGLIGYSIYRYYKKQIEFAKNYEYKVTGVRIINIAKDSVVLDITTSITNYSNISATVKVIYLEILINGVKVGTVNEVKDINVKANGTSEFSFRFAFDPQVVLGNIVNIVTLSIGLKDVNIEMDGFIKVESDFVKATVPFNYKNTLKALLKG